MICIVRFLSSVHARRLVASFPYGGALDWRVVDRASFFWGTSLLLPVRKAAHISAMPFRSFSYILFRTTSPVYCSASLLGLLHVTRLTALQLTHSH